MKKKEETFSTKITISLALFLTFDIFCCLLPDDFWLEFDDELDADAAADDDDGTELDDDALFAAPERSGVVLMLLLAPETAAALLSFC